MILTHHLEVIMRDTGWIRTTYFAHRGLHSKDKSIPENSLSAFSLAIEKGYGIELDINLLKDGQVVVFHDKDLTRMCRDSRLLSDVTLDDLSAIRLLDSDEKIPTLENVLSLVAGKVPLLIELKHHGDHVALCERFIQTIQGYPGTYAIHSFHPGILSWFRKHHPDIIRGQISEYFLEETNMKKITKYLLRTLFFNRFTKPDFINYGLRDLPNKAVDCAKRKGLIVIAYAARSQAEFDRVLERYDNAVFEYFEPKRRTD
jgi:glycerophosphoryl diester phosphodiesterase